jgi:hypothetical protein
MESDNAPNGDRSDQSAWDDDPWRRALIERPPPLTWRGIVLSALVVAAGVVLGLAEVAGFWDGLALLLVIVGGIQLLRGLIRMAWLRMGGTDRPLRNFVRARVERWF